jgi:DNA topoisomerase-1
MPDLVIVESPAKIKKIQKFLGPGYIVKASMGHCFEIDPKDKNAIDTANNFEPKYIVSAKKKKTVTEIKDAAKKCSTCYIASDPDREGEAIGWHLAEFVIKQNCVIKRATFHEITKSAVLAAFSNTTNLNEDMYHAQQARAVLDRLVGYGVSPVLWRKVCKGTSAGRVQSIGLKFISDRQAEIDKFVPEEYWEIEGLFYTKSKEELKCAYIHKGKISNEKDAKDTVASINKVSSWGVDSIEQSEKKRSPAPPFSTSTMQQFAASYLGWPGKKTMSVAQKLYENGSLTYHRTDSLNISKEAMELVRDHVKNNIGQTYLPSSPNYYKTKNKSAQEAHECIRPTDLGCTSTNLGPDEDKLYDVIYKRFVSSQMTAAVFDTTKITVMGDKHEFSVSGQTLKFDGYLKVWTYGSSKEETLPSVKKSEAVSLNKVIPTQHFTKPPAAFNDASIVKTMEEHGVGRPSTYASIIDTLLFREYVTRENKAFKPTELGVMVCNYLTANFPELMDTGYTSRVESKLDEIAEGKEVWYNTVGSFYNELTKRITAAQAGKSFKESEETEIVCPECGKHKLVIRRGKYGKFYGCAGYLEKGKNKCKGMFKISDDGTPLIKEKPKALVTPSGETVMCDKCGSVVVVRKSTKTGKDFGGCSKYPACKRLYDLEGKPIEYKKRTYPKKSKD